MKSKLLAFVCVGVVASIAAAQGPLDGPPPFEQPGMPGAAQPRPELATKMMQILALREMLAAGITTKDIRAVLPPLRDLLVKERAMQKDTDAILTQVRDGLIHAQPGDAELPDAGEKLRGVVDKYRASETQAWGAIAKAVGREKSARLRGLLSGFPGMRGPGAGPGMPPQGMEGGPGGGPDGAPPDRGGPGPRDQGRRGDGGPGRGGEMSRRDDRSMDGMSPGGMPGGRPRLTLAELVNLLDQKLAAASK